VESRFFLLFQAWGSPSEFFVRLDVESIGEGFFLLSCGLNPNNFGSPFYGWRSFLNKVQKPRPLEGQPLIHIFFFRGRKLLLIQE
jgi:hypothetical protein